MRKPRSINNNSNRVWQFLCLSIWWTYGGLPFAAAAAAAHDEQEESTEKHNGENHVAHLFAPPPEIQVWGPSEFPKPNDKLWEQQSKAPPPEGAVPVVHVEPTYGTHRPDQDAILAYAEGYKLPWYQMFMNTLTTSGYRGDVVLAIAEERIVSEHVVEFLKTFTTGDTNKPNLVIYQQALDCDNNSPDNKEYYGTNKRQLTKHGDTNPFQMCRLPHVYGWKKTDGSVDTVPDPRDGRVVATLRFEWYWIWAQKYNPHSWLMLLDARDSFFQSDPFAHVPRTDPTQPKTKGLLYLFGENAEATRLGISKKNQQWIRRAYGDATIEVLKDKPTICSGSTMGEQVALETYIRAMVNEHDECEVKMMGSDQGFHNFLYYSQKMTQASTIERIIVWEQGRGQINNLGALRTKPLKEWGKLYNAETHQVFQWPFDDNDPHEELVLSPVVHQWDRDKDLHSWMTRTKHRAWEKEWISRHATE